MIDSPRTAGTTECFDRVRNGAEPVAKICKNFAWIKTVFLLGRLGVFLMAVLLLVLLRTIEVTSMLAD